MRFYLACLFVLSAALSGCTSRANLRGGGEISSAVLYAFREETAGGEYQILDYQGMNRGQRLPWWVEPYLRGGAAAVESSSENPYTGRYLFVSAQKSSNLAALLQWMSAQNSADFSTMFFPRMYRRIIRGISESPERYYGAFFDKALKALADADWKEAALADSFWIALRLQPQSASGGQENAVNLALSLAVIDRQIFQRRVNQILDHIPKNREQTRDQRQAANRLKSNFFSNF
ncbi:MAG: hypothetical protein LBG72_06590 [Spirochaetaceae bacterium]|jgi:hypothetical protein|nr:hypothetical protein [Spirochaetaceae bacterium]